MYILFEAAILSYSDTFPSPIVDFDVMKSASSFMVLYLLELSNTNYTFAGP